MASGSRNRCAKLCKKGRLLIVFRPSLRFSSGRLQFRPNETSHFMLTVHTDSSIAQGANPLKRHHGDLQNETYQMMSVGAFLSTWYNVLSTLCMNVASGSLAILMNTVAH